jgi:hypothetical protein
MKNGRNEGLIAYKYFDFKEIYLKIIRGIFTDYFIF